MSKKRVTLKRKAGFSNGSTAAKAVHHFYKKRGTEYSCYKVDYIGEDGKPKRKQFPDHEKAQVFADSVNINLKNKGRNQSLLLTSLSEDQLRQAERAFTSLGDTYTLDEAVNFYLENHRAPEFTISVLDGLKHYIDAKETEGVREPTRRSTEKTIKAYARHSKNPLVHKVTEQSITHYLKSLRARDKVSPAKKKTWNNNRNELASFFIWAGKKDLTTNRPWTFSNPTEDVTAFSNKRVAEERPDIAVTAPETTQEIFTYLMDYKGGQLVKYFALAYFAGIRPSTEQGELAKLAQREEELINLTTGRIMLSADMSLSLIHI